MNTSGNWWANAACLDHDPELWFSGGRGEGRTPEQTRAMRICGTCPVIAHCFTSAHQHETSTRYRWGIWAGLTSRQRTNLRRKQTG